ncbi:transporter [Opitutaceae bacterium EW11]|nr:transporter [Opitutaceae bacterium EW11]
MDGYRANRANLGSSWQFTLAHVSSRPRDDTSPGPHPSPVAALRSESIPVAIADGREPAAAGGLVQCSRPPSLFRDIRVPTFGRGNALALAQGRASTDGMNRAAIPPAAHKAPDPRSRIDLVDALRGSALLGILLIHSVEHWDFMRNPDHSAPWLATPDAFVRDSAFFLFGGKAYGIFALLFGVSFFLILDSWSRRGLRFEGRFLWRLSVLALFGYVHGLVYCGDILLIIAALGVPLVFLNRLGTRALLWISALLMLQIPSVYETVHVLLRPEYQPPRPLHWDLYGRLFGVYADGSLLDVLRVNLWTGQAAKTWWTIETARWLQMIGLFVWGLLLGREGVFENPIHAVRLARRALIAGVVGFAVLYPVKLHLGGWGLSGMRHHAVENLVSSYCNLTQLLVWAGGFTLLYQWGKARGLLRLLAPYGRMSLSCYVTQALIGVPLFYGFGLALFRFCGPFYSILIGGLIGVVQITAANLWLKRFNYGPLEWLWRALTFMDFNVPMRRRAARSRMAEQEPQPVSTT